MANHEKNKLNGVYSMQMKSEGYYEYTMENMDGLQTFMDERYKCGGSLIGALLYALWYAIKDEKPYPAKVVIHQSHMASAYIELGKDPGDCAAIVRVPWNTDGRNYLRDRFSDSHEYTV